MYVFTYVLDELLTLVHIIPENILTYLNNNTIFKNLNVYRYIIPYTQYTTILCKRWTKVKNSNNINNNVRNKTVISQIYCQNL